MLFFFFFKNARYVDDFTAVFPAQNRRRLPSPQPACSQITASSQQKKELKEKFATYFCSNRHFPDLLHGVSWRVYLAFSSAQPLSSACYRKQPPLGVWCDLSTERLKGKGQKIKTSGKSTLKKKVSFLGDNYTQIVSWVQACAFALIDFYASWKWGGSLVGCFASIKWVDFAPVGCVCTRVMKG